MNNFIPRGIDYDTQSIDDLGSEDLSRALILWESWCDGREAPAWPDIDLPSIPAALLPLTTVVDVIDGGQDYVYRYWGSGLTKLYGRDETGCNLSNLSVSRSRQLRFEQFDRVVATRIPHVFMTAFAEAEKTYARKQNLRLPICDETKTVTKILSLSTMRSPKLGRFDNLHAFLQAKLTRS